MKNVKMQQTMRWFGPNDTVKLRDIRQCGVTGVVTALHDIPVGNVWPVKSIKERQQMIRDAGMEWTVVESLPVSEDIKRGKGERNQHIENYKMSLRNLASCGIRVITYNFMPILDWVRTHHAYENPDGTKALLYDPKAFAYFDLYLLKRPQAENDYTDSEKADALAYGKSLDATEKNTLFKNILLGLPGSSEDFTATQILKLLDNYAHIDDDKLREHLIYFLAEIAPVANEVGVSLAIHPDDPPFSVLGLPRVVSTARDLERIFEAVPLLANGLCYCTGSLGAHPDNDLVKIIEAQGERIHFLHLRNVIKDGNGVFRESEHLHGDNPMETIMEKIVLLMQRRAKSIPMRPDHGFLHDFEGKKEQYPGYSLMGRMKGLAELRGLEMGIAHGLN